MNKYLKNICLAVTTLTALGSVLPAEAGKQKEVYIPMDYSTCGYHASE